MSEQSESEGGIRSSMARRLFLAAVLSVLWLCAHYEKNTARSWEEIRDD